MDSSTRQSFHILLFGSGSLLYRHAFLRHNDVCPNENENSSLWSFLHPRLCKFYTVYSTSGLHHKLINGS